MKSPDERSGKKEYRRPQLVVYGHIREITATTGLMNKNADSGKGTNNKT